jgi:hypothetical protein
MKASASTTERLARSGFSASDGGGLLVVETFYEFHHVCEQRGSIIRPVAHDDWRRDLRLLERKVLHIIAPESAH